MADDITIVVNAQDNFSGVLGNFGSIMTGIESVVNLASQAFGFAKDVIGDFVNSASESEQATARLDGVLRATGGSVGLTSEQLQDMANSLQNVTRFSDETILNGEAILLTFRNIGGEMFERTVPAMADMAEIFGSVDSAAMQLGKALNDPLTGMGALSRAGITFSEEQKDMIKNFMDMGDIASAQNIILSEVEAQVSGLAETMGDTFSGKVAIFNNALDTVKETIGGALLPILSGFLDKFQESIPVLQTFAGALSEAISTGDFSALFSVFEDGSSYLQSFIELLGVTEEQAGQLAAALLNLDMNALGEMFVNWAMSIDWNKISDDLAAGIRSVDWAKLGAFISEAIGYGVMGLSVIIEGIDWQNVFNAIGEAFANFIAGFYGYIDWDALAVDFGKGLEYALVAGFGYVDWDTLKNDFQNGWNYIIHSSSVSTLQQIIDDFKTGVNYVKGQLRDIGEDIAKGFEIGFFAGVGEITLGIVKYFDDLVADIKLVLGISSPSTIFRQIGVDIVQGLIGGFTATWSNLLTIANNALGDFLDLFGIDLGSLLGSDASGLGTASGGVGTTGGGSGGGTSGQTVNNYFYGPVYIGSSLDDANYDCPSPNPLVAASGNQLVATGF